MNLYSSPDDNDMEGFNQFLNISGPMPGFTQFEQNMPMRQPKNSPSFHDSADTFLSHMSSIGMYQPQMPMSQKDTGLSNEQYQQYLNKYLIGVMLNKVQHNIKEQMKMKTFLQQFM